MINNKKRLDCFYGTDLEILLRTLGTETVVLMGINTNTCVMNTAFSAFNRDFQVVVIEDCVASCVFLRADRRAELTLMSGMHLGDVIIDELIRHFLIPA